MALRKRKRIQPIVSSSSMLDCPYRFFKVILPSSLEDKKLRIPEKFVKKFGDELCGVAKLTVPNGGCVWRVGLEKDGRTIWFHDGWHDFVKYHSISVGFFLVFKYAKNSTFEVLIFDMTACEIDYSNSCGEPKHKGQNSVHGDEMETEDSTEILGSKITDKNGKYETQRSLRHCKKYLNKTAMIQSATWEDEHQTDIVSYDGGFKETAHKRPKFDGHELLAVLEDMGISVCYPNRYHTVKETQRAVSAARLFKPKNPSFMIFVQAANRRRGYLHIPAKFTHKYLTTIAKSIKVQVSDGREWLVQTRRNQSGCLSLAKGWSRIWDGMNLGGGDICLFELIKEEEFLLKLSVFYAFTEVNVS